MVVMLSILDIHTEFYKSITVGEKKHIIEQLKKDGIKVLTGFVDNLGTVQDFYTTYYSSAAWPRIVLCGINPGRLGAGKTGVPFLDFKSLSQLLDAVTDQDEEKSAQFIWKLIETFPSPKKFFESVYLTNISWFGFTQSGKNLNYYKLPGNLQGVFVKSFVREMEILKPKVIIPLSKDVAKTLRAMNLDYTIGKSLNHPYYCCFPAREQAEVANYAATINRYQ